MEIAVIIAQIFISFLFFKIFPEFAYSNSPNALTALLMAIVSTLVGIGFNLWCTRLFLNWQSLTVAGGDTDAFPWECLGALALGVPVAGAASYLVATGFSPRFVRSAFGFGEDPFFFWVMLAIPPLTIAALNLPALTWGAKKSNQMRPKD